MKCLQRAGFLSASFLAASCLWLSASAEAHWHPVNGHNVWHASMKAWCGSNNRICWNGTIAYRVAWCESKYNPWADNGDHEGYWQLGVDERRQCGQTKGRDPWTQARAAHCWWRKAGWDAWSQCL